MTHDGLRLQLWRLLGVLKRGACAPYFHKVRSWMYSIFGSELCTPTGVLDLVLVVVVVVVVGDYNSADFNGLQLDFGFSQT